MPMKKKPSITAQQPKPGPISFQDIQWAPKTRKGFGKMLTILAAYLPFNRVQDFIAGQTCLDGSVVEWSVADRARGVQVGRPQIDSYIEHIHYECAFGPKDHTGDPQHPHSKKRGCLAKFSIKQLLLFPEVVEVAYYHVDHTREDGSLAHGLENKLSTGRKSAYQPRMSKELKDWVKAQLSKGITAQQIYEEYRRDWIQRTKTKCADMRDEFVQLKDIVYYESRLKMGVWRCHHNDVESVKMCALEHPTDTSVWHGKNEVTDLPFILDTQTPWSTNTNIGENVDSDPIEPLRQTEPSVEDCLSAIDKLLEAVKEEAKEGGLLLVQQLQVMMTKTLTDVKQIREQMKTDILHPKSVFEVDDDDLENSIVRKKDLCEQAMIVISSQRKRNRSTLDG